MRPGIELKIANTEEAEFLLQAELNSIERGCTYVEDRQVLGSDGVPYTWSGYVNSIG